MADWLFKKAADARRVRRKLERRYRQTATDADWTGDHTVLLADQLVSSLTSHGVSTSNVSYRKRQINHKNAGVLLMRSYTRLINAEDSQQMCNIFSEFFTNKFCTIRQTITDGLKLTLSSPPDITLSTPIYRDHYYAVTEVTVKQVIDSYPTKFLPLQLELVPLWLIKQCNDIFSYLICRLANISFNEGIYPEVFKVGQVTPLIKKAGTDINYPADYRSITNLNSIGKILKKTCTEATHETHIKPNQIHLP